MERLEDALFEIDMNWEVQKTTDDLSVKSVKIGILPQLDQFAAVGMYGTGEIGGKDGSRFDGMRQSVRFQRNMHICIRLESRSLCLENGFRREAIRLLLEYRSIGFEIEGLKRHDRSKFFPK